MEDTLEEVPVAFAAAVLPVDFIDIGQQLELSLLRAGTQLTLNATIAARPSR